MNNPTDTNQASEDGLKQRLSDTKTFNYNVYFGVDGGDYAISFDEALDEIVDLIRTEKLKLLAEVREQTTIFKIKAHDKKGQPHLYEAGRGVPTEVLNKLEAEL